MMPRGGPYKTHCKHGHKYTPENTIWRGTRRNCRTCTKNRNKSWESKRRRNPRIVKDSLRAQLASFCDGMAAEYEKQIAGRQVRTLTEPHLSKLKAQHWRILAKFVREFKQQTPGA